MKKLLNTKINEILRTIVIPEHSLQMIDFKMKCLEFTTYAKIPTK